MDEARAGAEQICRTLAAHGYRALLAGGCVRDLVTGATPEDYDIATSARPEEIAALFPRTIGVGAAFGVQVVLSGDTQYEVATFRVDGPYSDGRRPDFVEFSGEEADARRRDFTINALFYDVDRGEVVDYVGGREDIAARIVRAVGDPSKRFHEDPLRLMRAVRFAARLDFTIEAATFDAIRALAAEIMRTSAERVRDELVKMLTGPHPDRALRLLDESGLLEQILPEVHRMKGVEQPPEFHPEGDVFTHTVLALSHLDHPGPALALGVLLHDVGKPLTQTFEDRIRFNLHEKVGTIEAGKICRRLRLPNEVTERVQWLVSEHMRVDAAREMRESKRKRLVREEGFAELLELYRIDCLASRGDLAGYEWLRDYAANLTPATARPAPLLTGDDLIALGYAPGPAFREMLQAVEDEQLEGRLQDRDAAVAFVRGRWPIGGRDCSAGDSSE